MVIKVIGIRYRIRVQVYGKIQVEYRIVNKS